jgi:bacillithiol biosynthesis cysteine-adding enzyme BshC
MHSNSPSAVSFEQSNQFSKIIIDYAHNSANLTDFYNLRPEIASYKTMMEQKNYNNSFRPILVEQLKKQYADADIKLNKSTWVETNINLLLSPNTYTVTTGHQLCLFTGPLYFIHKILSTIKWCEELKLNYPAKNFIPVFWMASEDHDFAEVNHLYVNSTKHTWDIDSKQQPVGRLTLENFENFAQKIIDLASNEFAKNQLKEWSKCYTTSSNLSIATRKLAHLLFGDKGLVILDADSKPLKKLFIPIIKNDVLDQKNFNILTETNNLLRKKYKTQVNGREINFFYISNEGRKLIKKENDTFSVDGTSITFSKKEIAFDIENHPENYSPNVIMRPLYQELILPNLSYIGGPGEIAYWLQLKPIFDYNQISFPILTLRDFVMLINEQHINQLHKIGLDAADLFSTNLDVERKLVLLNEDGGQDQLIDDVATSMQKLIDTAMKTDNKIGSELIKCKTDWNTKLYHLHRELDKKQREKIKHQFDKYTSIKDQYFTSGTMQERVSNVLSYGVSESVHHLIHLIYLHLSRSQSHINVIVKKG